MANLFDFTSIMPGATRASTQSELNPFGASLDITGGVRMAPAPYISGTTQEQATQMETVAKGKMDSENNKMIIQGFIDATKGNPSLSSRREAVKKMIENGEDESFIVDAIQNKMGISPKTAATSVIEEQKQEPGVGSTLKGIGEKTATAFTEGLKQAGEGLSGAARGIGSNIYQMTHGGEKATDIGRPLIEGLIGAGRAVTSPIEGVVSQGIEQVAAPVASAITPEVVKDLAKEGFANAQEWYNSQSEPTKQLIKDTGLTAEGALNILGVKTSPKAAEAALKGAAKVTEAEIQGAKALVKGTTQGVKDTGKILKNIPSAIDEGIETGVEKVAGKFLGSSDGSKELFKATSPSYNTLSKSKDIKNIVNNAKTADETIVLYGRTPKNTSERVTAYRDTMGDVWKKIETARGGTKEKFDAGELAKVIDDEVSKLSVGGVMNPALASDVAALQKQAEYFRNIGKIDIPTLGNQKTLINSLTDWGSTTQFGDTFSSTMKKVVKKIGESEDSILSKLNKGTTAEDLRRYGALRSMFDDIVKQDIKALRAKGMSLEESFGRIAGGAELLGGIAQLVMNPKQAIPTILSGGSKVLLGKVAGKIKDPDYLIKTGYEKLKKKSTIPNSKLQSSKKPVKSQVLKKKQVTLK